eukprot:TRINITY_DN1514_c0_g1_i1.p1 TRINITY_DN1514_c0_g1~~TRINITY_DN1514_c0_g1_i1.p1  ORF type:complete len:355 (-),score=51.67 TRINITY_DN1514_c0_g1_i1:184-1248(-)
MDGREGCPAFFLDVANFFLTQPGGSEVGVRVLSNIAELRLEDSRLFRIVGNKLWHEGEIEQKLQKLAKRVTSILPFDICFIIAEYLEGGNRPGGDAPWKITQPMQVGNNKLLQAKWLFERIIALKLEEPQSYRELGLVLAELGQYQDAITSLYHIIETEWPLRFQHIEDQIFLELNRIIWLANKAGVDLDTSFIDPCFLMLDPIGLHFTITWDTDDTCIDLHITQPDGIDCYYGRHKTECGGWSTPDYNGCTSYSTSMLREYIIKNPLPGKYTIKCNYYSNKRQDLIGSTIIWFNVYTNYLMENEKKQTTMLRLESNSAQPSARSSYTIGTVEYGISPLFQSWYNEWEMNSARG